MILSTQSIRKRCQASPPLVVTFHERTVSAGRSFGLSSCGYDVRLAQDLWLWPFWGRKASTMERFHFPDDVCGEVKDKSTHARLFILVQNTVAEPGWFGYLTLEQIMFKMLDEPTERPYRGKYQNQPSGPQPAILEPELPFFD